MPPPADSRQLERVMAKPTDDPHLEQRVAALEEQVEQNTAAIADYDIALIASEAAIDSLEARVTALENAVTAPPQVDPPGGIIDNTLPEPEEPEPEPGEGLAVVIR